MFFSTRCTKGPLVSYTGGKNNEEATNYHNLEHSVIIVAIVCMLHGMASAHFASCKLFPFTIHKCDHLSFMDALCMLAKINWLAVAIYFISPFICTFIGYRCSGMLCLLSI